MEKAAMDKERQRKVERLILTVYSLYTITMTFTAIQYHWRDWIPMLILAGMAFSLFFYWKQYRDYKFRAFFTATMAWMNFSLYVLNMDNFAGSLSTMAAMVILLAIYCIPEIVYIGVACYTVLLVYHMILFQSLTAGIEQDGLRGLLRIVSVYVAEYVTYCLIKTQKESNEKLMENITSLKQAERSKDEFLSNVSHEIRTPLNTICGMSELMLREKLSEKAREEVFHIQAAGRGLQAIVSDVLDFSELETGKMFLTEEAYNFSSVMNDVINMAVAQNEDKQLELLVDCDAAMPCSMVGDSEKLCRVISNLAGNAIKFTEKGCVLIKVSVRTEQYGVNLCVTVKDTGKGMDAETKEKLFTSFNQVDTKKNRTQGGIGLGIAISQKMVNLMNGFLTVDSNPERGSEFRFVVPQRVADTRPMIEVKNKEEIHVLSYYSMEKFDMVEIRDCYTEMIRHMAEQLEVRLTMCMSLGELKQRILRGGYTHLFIGASEYREQPEYFTELSREMPVILVLNKDEEHDIKGSFLRIYKPFYALSVAAALNGENLVQCINGSHQHIHRFTAPEASVLVVDDSIMNLKVMEGLLRPYAVHLFTATSGKEALKMLDWAHYDLIFMDHMMPEMDGVETLHEIRKKKGGYYQTVPIVALTANAIGGAREMFLAEGFYDFVAKPVELSALERVLKKYIPSGLIRYHEEQQPQTAESERSEETFAGKETQPKTEVQAKQWRIDEEQGLMYAGGEMADYKEIMQIYYEEGLQKKEKIKKLYEAADWKEYTVLVHALKSTSQSIGANGLFEMAKAQELAGKQCQTEILTAGQEPLMEEYDAVLAEIKQRWGETDV